MKAPYGEPYEVATCHTLDVADANINPSVPELLHILINKAGHRIWIISQQVPLGYTRRPAYKNCVNYGRVGSADMNRRSHFTRAGQRGGAGESAVQDGRRNWIIGIHFVVVICEHQGRSRFERDRHLLEHCRQPLRKVLKASAHIDVAS